MIRKLVTQQWYYLVVRRFKHLEINSVELQIELRSEKYYIQVRLFYLICVFMT